MAKNTKRKGRKRNNRLQETKPSHLEVHVKAVSTDILRDRAKIYLSQRLLTGEPISKNKAFVIVRAAIRKYGNDLVSDLLHSGDILRFND